MNLRLLGVASILGLILLTGAWVAQARTSSAEPASPHATACAGPATAPSFTINATWQDDAGRNISVEYSDGCLNTLVLTDSSCPDAVGHFFVKSLNNDADSVINGSGYITGGVMLRCTPASNPIVENCSQDAQWGTTYNATVTQYGIVGTFEEQYWTWNTTSSGDIIPNTCKDEYNYSAPFSITPIIAVSSSTSSTTSSPASSTSSVTVSSSAAQSSTSEVASAQTSSRSTTTNTSTTSTHSGSSGHLGIAVYAGGAAAVVVVVVASLWALLRARPARLGPSSSPKSTSIRR